MSKDKRPLHYEIHGDLSQDTGWFRLYECEHITQKTYPVEAVIPLGDHTNLILCVHCYQHAEGIVFGSIVRETAKALAADEIEAIRREYPNNFGAAILADKLHTRINAMGPEIQK